MARTGLDENFENFIQEIGEHGRRAREKKREARDWWYGTFGIVGPLLGAAIGMIVVAIIAWLMSIVYAVVGAPLLSMMSTFLFTNLPVFLLIFLITNYLKHIYLSHDSLYYIVKPVKVAFEVMVAFWLFAWVLQFAGMQAGSIQLMTVSVSLMGSLAGIFLVFLVAGYIFAMAKRGSEIYGKK